MARYQDKKVVILGGTSGMGLATAKKLLAEGARVLVTGRSQAGLDSAKQELGTDALMVSSDARSLTDIEARPRSRRGRALAGGGRSRPFKLFARFAPPGQTHPIDRRTGMPSL